MYQCCMFSYPTAEEAGRNFKFEVIEEFSACDYTYYSWNDRTQRLEKCKKCGALFLHEHFEFKAMRYEDNDYYYSVWYPVNDREEALAYSKYDGRVLNRSYKGVFLEWIDQGRSPWINRWRWRNRK